MGICPKDLKPCIDDICYGAGCIRLGGETMLTRCECGALIGMDGSDPYNECECDQNDDMIDDFE